MKKLEPGIYTSTTSLEQRVKSRTKLRETHEEIYETSIQQKRKTQKIIYLLREQKYIK